MENIVNKPTDSNHKLRIAIRIVGVVGFAVLVIFLAMNLKYWWTQTHSIYNKEDKPDLVIDSVPTLSKDDVYNQKTSNISTSTEIVKIAFTGDQGDSLETKKALQMIRKEKAEALVVLGDFEYKNDAKLWQKNLDDYLGVYFPVLAVAGNHEEAFWADYAKVVQAKIGQLPKDMCSAETKKDIGLTYDCTVGPAHIVFVTPNINISDSKLKDPTLFIRNVFKKELASKTFIQEPMADGEEDNPSAMPSSGGVKDPWRVCAWHKVNPLIQLGTKTDDVPWSIYEECRRFGAYIFTGHDHVYARSKTVMDFPGMIVASSTLNEIVTKPGSTGVAILGIGGKDIRPYDRKGDNWWASTYTLEKLKIESAGKSTTTAGIMFCTFNKKEDVAPCYFKTIDGVVRDQFVMKR